MFSQTDDNSCASQTQPSHVTEEKGSNTTLSFALGDHRAIIRNVRKRRKFRNKESPW